ncbi:hypothetical protein [Aestuariivirga sp.]|uniref:hypothetical protein n=1 Tax=Aestuariivirga sp. TaxID=2650926 RepID=UPI0035930CB0
MPFDTTTLYILILTVTNTLAIGGAAALLLFPKLLGAPPRRDGSADGLDMPGIHPQPEEPQPQISASRITWSLGGSVAK